VDGPRAEKRKKCSFRPGKVKEERETQTSSPWPLVRRKAAGREWGCRKKKKKRQQTGRANGGEVFLAIKRERKSKEDPKTSKRR